MAKASPPQTLGSYLDEIARNFPTRTVDLAEHMVLDRETKYVKVDLNPQKHTSVLLMHLTDFQFGHRACREDRIIEFRNWILDQPNCYVLLGGDLIDAATPLSVQSPYTNQWEPSEQVLRLVELLKPLRHRVLGSVGGNHERRTAKAFGDAGRLIATLLKTPYSGGVQHIDIEYGEHKPFKISLWHGAGGARTKGAKAQMLHRFMGQGDSQLYLVGHLHDVVVLYDWRQVRKRHQMRLQKIAGVMSSSFLSYWNTFAEQLAMAPSDTMMGVVLLEPSGKWQLQLR